MAQTGENWTLSLNQLADTARRMGRRYRSGKVSLRVAQDASNALWEGIKATPGITREQFAEYTTGAMVTAEMMYDIWKGV